VGGSGGGGGGARIAPLWRDGGVGVGPGGAVGSPASASPWCSGRGERRARRRPASNLEPPGHSVQFRRDTRLGQNARMWRGKSFLFSPPLVVGGSPARVGAGVVFFSFPRAPGAVLFGGFVFLRPVGGAAGART